jgi:ribose transport system permease protein
MAAKRLSDIFNLFGAAIILVAMLIVFSIFNPSFARFDNLMLILLTGSIIGIVAIGQTIVLLSGGIDLSVGSMVAFSGVIAAGLMRRGIPGLILPLDPYLAMLVAMAAGGLAGLFTGFMVAKVKMPPFIVTLGMASALKGLALVYTQASAINQLPDSFKWISDGQIGPVPAPVIIMVLLYLGAWAVLKYTVLGRYIYAIGGNAKAARLSGVPTDRILVKVYVISALLASAAGMILISRIDGGVYTNGEGYELQAVAAAVIGGTSLMGGSGNIWSTVFGVLIMAAVRNAMVMYSVPAEWTAVVTGAIIMLAVLLDTLQKRSTHIR